MSASIPAKRRKNEGLRAKLERFFADNPDEELTYDDIVTKFSASRKAAMSRVWEATNRGTLETVHIVKLAKRQA